MNGALYAYDASSSNRRNFLVDLIRSEQSAVAGQGKLTHFAADLAKLGTNIAGLNKQAQDTIIAQGIEWYYWRGKDYAGFIPLRHRSAEKRCRGSSRKHYRRAKSQFQLSACRGDLKEESAA